MISEKHALTMFLARTMRHFFTSERKWINYVYKLKESHPDEVDIRHVNDDGSLIVHIPASWMKIKPKKKVVLTDEQIEASKARLERGRQND